DGECAVLPRSRGLVSAGAGETTGGQPWRTYTPVRPCGGNGGTHSHIGRRRGLTWECGANSDVVRSHERYTYLLRGVRVWRTDTSHPWWGFRRDLLGRERRRRALAIGPCHRLRPTWMQP